MLDLCCGDSYILNFIESHINDYLGVDNSDKYLNYSKKKWPRFNFLNLDLNNSEESISQLEKFQPNLIFINGAIHHLDDHTIKNITSFINRFEESIFISIDPVKSNNKILNKIMIKLDRGKYIRTENEYKNLMQNYNSYDFMIFEAPRGRPEGQRRRKACGEECSRKTSKTKKTIKEG